MGYFDNIKERLDRQFISVTDSITFIVHQDSCEYQDAFNLVVKTLIFEQTHLLVVDELKLKTIFICREQDPDSHNAHITVEALIPQLEQQQLDGTNKNINNIGFGKKRFYEQLLNMGFVFDNRLLFEAQSPDIDYSDCETEGEGFAYYNGLPKEYEALKRSHEKLEQKLADTEANSSFMMGSPAVEQGEPKDSERIISELTKKIEQLSVENEALKQQARKQADTPADDDKELSTRSQNLAAKIILALIDLAGLDKDSPPYQYDDLSSNNSLIHDQIEANGMNVGKQKIGHWLDLAIKQTKDK